MITLSNRGKRFAVALVIVITTGTSIVIVSAQAGPSSAPAPAEIYSHNPVRVPPVAQLDSKLQGSLASFDRPATAADVAPADIVPADMRARGANRAIGRLQGTFNGQAVYLLPAQGGICLVSTTMTAMGCFSSDDVRADKTVGLLECYPYMPFDQQELFGVFPRVRTIVASYSDGSQRSLAVQGDVLVLDAKPDLGPYPVQIGWKDAAGSHSLATDMGRPLVPHPCTAQTVLPTGLTAAQAIAAARARIARGQE